MSLFEELFPDVRSEEEIASAIAEDVERKRATWLDWKWKNIEASREYSRNRMREKRARDPAGVAAYNKAWCAANPEKVRQRKREWDRKNPDKVEAIYLKSHYGITPEERDAIFAAQGHCCALCKTKKPNGKQSWHIDHDHLTNQVRGILCSFCNSMLGYARDRIETLRAGIEYLERFK